MPKLKFSVFVYEAETKKNDIFFLKPGQTRFLILKYITEIK